MVIAHRGNSALAPENTLAAFESAAIAGVGQIEIDIHPSADGHAIVIHDSSVDRTTDGSGLVSDLELGELGRLDAGGWFSPHYAGQAVPTMADVIALGHKYPQVGWLIEFKGVWSLDDAARLGDQLTEADLAGGVVLQGFEIATMEVLAQVLPEFTRGLLVGPVLDSTLDDARRLGVSQINPALQYVQAHPDAVATLREAGFDVNVWTANDVADWDLLIRAGATGIITDWPDRLLGYLAAS